MFPDLVAVLEQLVHELEDGRVGGVEEPAGEAYVEEQCDIGEFCVRGLLHEMCRECRLIVARKFGSELSRILVSTLSGKIVFL
jgi:hypothetical protein